MSQNSHTPPIMRTLWLSLLTGFAGLLAASASAQLGALVVDTRTTRSNEEIDARVDEAARNFARTLSLQTRAWRDTRREHGLLPAGVPLSLPMSVRLSAHPPSRERGRRSGQPLQLVFDTSGPRAFPTAYRDFLQAVFEQARPTLDLVLGPPSVGGPVRVRNYDIDLSDREYLAGGLYLPTNGEGQPEIRFPIYTSGGEEQRPTAAVNFIHCLLLAYIGPNAFAFDAFQEGLVRAATLRVVRTPGAMLPTLPADQLEAVLDLNYDAGPHYDWTNRRALSGPTFIAPNLRHDPLPIGGSLGGLYLHRYRMAGSAWQKVLVEHPNFLREFLSRYYARPEIAASVPALVALADETVRALGGPTAGVEGAPFPEWFTRQHILETRLSQGSKLFLEPIPIVDGLAGPDWGVFILEATYFTTRAGSEEDLGATTAYPIFWDPFFNRIFTSGGQDDRINFFLSYGSVTPNFPNLSAGNPYTAIVDLPVQDRLERVYLPAGAIATAASSGNPNNFYGTVTGIPPGTGAVTVRLTVGATPGGQFPVTGGAFGGQVPGSAYAGYQRLLIEVVRVADGMVLHTRRVNKGPGPLAVDLRFGGEARFFFPAGLPKGLSLIGFPVDPYITSHAETLNVAPSELLVARYNPGRAAYDLNPDTEAFTVGHGYFVRMPSAQSTFSVLGRTANVPTAVALRPGWNLVTCPLPTGGAFSRVRVVRGTSFPVTWNEARSDSVEGGPWIGADVFRFVPGNPDPISGAPEGGAMTSASGFEPGVGFFVRVMVPEGVTLLFEPPTAGGALLLPMPNRDGWNMQVTVASGQSRTDVVVGGHRRATAGFDPAHDSELPPGVGGTQAWSSLGTTMLYRDIRPLGTSETYRLRVSDLTPGRTYTVSFRVQEGAVRRFFLRDITGRRLVQVTPNATYRFVATSREREIVLTVRGETR